jgi:hypothetical protein
MRPNAVARHGDGMYSHAISPSNIARTSILKNKRGKELPDETPVEMTTVVCWKRISFPLPPTLPHFFNFDGAIGCSLETLVASRNFNSGFSLPVLSSVRINTDVVWQDGPELRFNSYGV